MTMEHDKIGEEKKNLKSAPDDNLRAKGDAAESDDAGKALRDHEEKIREQEYLVRNQYYKLMWAACVLSLAAPLLILYYVLRGMSSGAFEYAPDAVQAMMVSGAFFAFVSLYGGILFGLFKSKPSKTVMKEIAGQVKKILASEKDGKK